MSRVKSKQHKNTSFAILLTLCSVPIVMVLGNSMLIPVLPKIASIYKISSFQVSLLISLFSIAAGIVIPIAGILSDRIGRKKIIAGGLIIYGLGGLMAGLVSFFQCGYTLLLTSRILQGIGAAGTSPIVMVLIGDLFKKEERSQALGIIEASNAMGKVLSPILGSVIAIISWYAMFFVFPIFTIPIVFALWKFIEEPVSEKKPQPLKEYFEHVVDIFQEQGKWLAVCFFVGMMIIFTAFGILFHLSEFLETTYKIEGIKKGLILAIPLLALCGTAFFTGTYLKKNTKLTKSFIMTGLVITALSIAIIPWLKSVLLLIISSFVIGTGSGLILPSLNTLVTSATGLEERGIITSIYGSVRFFGVAFGPSVFGILSNKPYLLFIGNSAILVICLLLSFLFINQPHSKENNEHPPTLHLHSF